MAICRHYKKVVCAGSRSCMNSNLTNTKVCPYTKDGKFLGKKACEACRGFAAKPKAACAKKVSGPYVPGCTEVGKYYFRLFPSGSVTALDIVDHCGSTVGAGHVLTIDNKSGAVHRCTSVSSGFGFDRERDGQVRTD